MPGISRCDAGNRQQARFLRDVVPKWNIRTTKEMLAWWVVSRVAGTPKSAFSALLPGRSSPGRGDSFKAIHAFPRGLIRVK